MRDMVFEPGASLCERLEQILREIKGQSRGQEVLVLAVSKGQSVDAMRQAIACGQKAFGESYVQEALVKQEQLSGFQLEWHYIGPLQSNKTGAIARHFDWVHGVVREKIAGRLSTARLESGLPPIQACLQVNLSGEASKSGVSPRDLEQLAAQVSVLPGIRLRGLMTLPERSDDQGVLHERFSQLRLLRDALNLKGYGLDTLSMGMSSDFSVAVSEGSTIVRIGTAIFGERDEK